ncbi:twitching motility protein PilT [Dissulfurispira thermophila]|uniref:Twitching motility protein PilT n=2 Tax=root TaxID=1 RepID=A0A7G1H4H3_9BACT|nr:PilT/PilU family type 4a pilus ATPase [Dissulfurispira thermophila]BCB96647.1 twitching motility protein PilT [Dissulfurispira thermophila]
MRKPEIDYILSTMLDSHANVSDLNLTVGKPPQVESSGQLVPVLFENISLDSLTPFQTEIFALNLINADRRLTETLIKEGSCDLSYHLPDKARFRVNIFSQRGSYSIVLRKLSTTIPTLADLKVPEVLAQIAEEKNGLVLVTGATGSGKSSTLAAILRIINETKPVHVITLEDPVEFAHPHIKATFNQRELGIDFDTFANGLRAALRQAPKVILVGEMRDRETVEIGLTAAETGHLVLSTLHTIDAGQTINRIIGMFEQEEEKQIRTRLADTIRWIVSQRLVPKIGGGRVAVVEVMKSNIRVKDTILNGESEGKTFYDIIDQGEAFGMQTFDKALIKLYEDGVITEETAIAYASKKPIVGRGIDMIKAKRGEKTTPIEGLKLDKEYEKKIKEQQFKSKI